MYKAQLALYGDEVRIWIFDDPAENQLSQYPKFCFTQLNSISSEYRAEFVQNIFMKL